MPLPKLWLIDRLMAPVIRPLSRLLVGLIAIPLFRLFRTRVLRLQELDEELEKDFEQWFRASLLLLLASKNVELQIAEWSSVNFNLDIDRWYVTLGRLMLAISVIEAMPDQELFAIIHPGPPPFKYERKKGLWRCCREQCWPYLRGTFFRHLNRSSPVLAIMAVIFGRPAERGELGLCPGMGLLLSGDRPVPDHRSDHLAGQGGRRPRRFRPRSRPPASRTGRRDRGVARRRDAGTGRFRSVPPTAPEATGSPLPPGGPRQRRCQTIARPVSIGVAGPRRQESDPRGNFSLTASIGQHDVPSRCSRRAPGMEPLGKRL